MTPLHPRRNSKRPSSRTGRPAPTTQRRPGDFWRAVPKVDVPDPVIPAADPTALLRSLGSPPLAGQAEAGRYLAAVIDRAAGLATALAVQADILASEDI
ncbi:MAG: hypothetical protein M3159_04915 [Actinomycetota bacterium]|nr:hypothetical protein [Actinomycetota bacterium]